MPWRFDIALLAIAHFNRIEIVFDVYRKYLKVDIPRGKVRVAISETLYYIVEPRYYSIHLTRAGNYVSAWRLYKAWRDLQVSQTAVRVSTF